MDMANYTISKMRSSIRQQAVQYEKENFAKLLDTQRQAGFDGLQATKIWLRIAYDRLVQKLANETGTVPENRSNIPVPNLILAEAYILLMYTELDFNFPETLMMDKDRMDRLANRLTVLVCLASLVLFTSTLVAQHFSLNSDGELDVGNHWQSLKNCIKNHCRNIISLHMEEGFKAGKGANLS
ncbi:hypothetical protein Ciccas_010246 [Cichlidogyrus casuarinus]|uniref:Uncharacterized protein n=1 Tax=Cichlidogyrus casuarinus TaxID=1844966 RepID=A0ABD2PUM5_9PLAT